MKEWFNNLEQREKQMVSVGAVALLVLMIYVLAWDPFVKRYASLEASARENEQLVAWLQERAQEVGELRAAMPSHGLTNQGQSILGNVDKTAKAMGLSESIKRVQPEGTTKARVSLEDASFDKVVRWLENLQRQQGINVESGAIEKQEEPGLVNVRLVLEGSE